MEVLFTWKLDGVYIVGILIEANKRLSKSHYLCNGRRLDSLVLFHQFLVTDEELYSSDRITDRIEQQFSEKRRLQGHCVHRPHGTELIVSSGGSDGKRENHITTS
jgi:hypothetical protein